MNELLEHVEKAICARSLFTVGERILVAVSGGVDSMVLLDVLRELSSKSDWHLTVAHFNHLLRGRSSDADERLVRRTAGKLELPMGVERANVRAFAKKHKLSVEMAGRK